MADAGRVDAELLAQLGKSMTSRLLRGRGGPRSRQIEQIVRVN